jgi:hypothetical protein
MRRPDVVGAAFAGLDVRRWRADRWLPPSMACCRFVRCRSPSPRRYHPPLPLGGRPGPTAAIQHIDALDVQAGQVRRSAHNPRRRAIKRGGGPGPAPHACGWPTVRRRHQPRKFPCPARAAPPGRRWPAGAALATPVLATPVPGQPRPHLATGIQPPRCASTLLLHCGPPMAPAVAEGAGSGVQKASASRLASERGRAMRVGACVGGCIREQPLDAASA